MNDSGRLAIAVISQFPISGSKFNEKCSPDTSDSDDKRDLQITNYTQIKPKRPIPKLNTGDAENLADSRSSSTRINKSSADKIFSSV